MGIYPEAWAIALRLRVEASGNCGSEWKTRERGRRHAEASERPGRGQKRSGRPWERAEDAERHRRVIVHYKISSGM